MNLKHSLLSYLVRRFLGPLLNKDDQPSSSSEDGTLVLKDLRLNPKALQDRLASSISPFTIQSVSLAQISLEINWPTWSFSLQGYVPDVKLTLDDIQVSLAITDTAPDPPQSQSQSQSTFLESINLDESLANIASDFVRQEWADSPDHDPFEQDFPGAFTAKPHLDTSSASEDRQGFFAGLVQKILAKFNFQFNRLKISLDHQQFQVLLSIENGTSLNLPAEVDQDPNLMSREIRIACPVVYLQPIFDHQADPMPSPSSSSSPSSDSENDMLMSQAIVDLRVPPLFVSAAEILQPAGLHPSQGPPPVFTQSFLDPQNILIQFSGSSPDSSAQPSEPLSTESIPLPQKSSQEQAQDLKPNQSIRFLFWFIQGSSSQKAVDDECDTSQLPSTDPPAGDKMRDGSVQSSRLKIHVHVPILSVFIQLPYHLEALNQLISTILVATPIKSASSDSDILTTPDTPSLAINVILSVEALNCTFSFPTLHSQLKDQPDNLLSSIIIESQKIQLVYASQTHIASNQSSSTKSESELSIQFDRFEGKCNIKRPKANQQSSTQINPTFLLAPAREDHQPSLALSLKPINTIQIIFSSIWLNIELEVLSTLIPMIEVLQQTELFTSSQPGPPSTRSNHKAGENLEIESPTIPTSSSRLSNQARRTARSNYTHGEDHSSVTPTITILIPCLYLDIKSSHATYTQQQLDPKREPWLVFGSVIKSLQANVKSKNQISCSIFEAAFGFRVGNTNQGAVEEEGGLTQRHAPLEPFLGIAHPIVPDSKTDQDRYPGFQLTHTLGAHDSLNPSSVADPSSPYQPTSIKVETVTIDLTKHQFDRLQYWLDGLSRWANKFLLESPATTPAHAHNPRIDNSKKTNEPIVNDEDEKKSLCSSLLGTLTVSQLTIALRLPPSSVPHTSHDDRSNQKASPSIRSDYIKLVLQFNQLVLRQTHLSGYDHDGDSQIEFTISSCVGSLLDHQKNLISSVLLSFNKAHDQSHQLKDKQDAISVRICSTAQSQSQYPTPRSKSKLSTSSTPAKNQKQQLKLISIAVKVHHVSLRLGPCCIWTEQLMMFLKAPPDVFEAVGPEYETRVKFLFANCSIQFVSPPSTAPATTTATATPTTAVTATGINSSTEGGPEVAAASAGGGFVIEILSNQTHLQISLDPPSSSTQVSPRLNGTVSINLAEWPDHSSLQLIGSESIAFAQIASFDDFQLSMLYPCWPSDPTRRPTCQVKLHKGSLVISLCADSADGLGQAIARISQIPFTSSSREISHQVELPPHSEPVDDSVIESIMLRSAMRDPSSASARPLLIERGEDLAGEDYPTDVAFVDGHHAGSNARRSSDHDSSVIIRSLCSDGLNIIDDYLLTSRPSSKALHQTVEAEVKVEQLDVSLNLYGGYDWNSTRQTIQQAQRTVRKRLQKIRQLLATGNPAEAISIEEDLIRPTTTRLFNSVQLGLDSETRGLSPAQLLNVIDHQLKNHDDGVVDPAVMDDDVECLTGSWQSLTPHSSANNPLSPPPQSRPKFGSSTKQSQLGRSNQPMLKVVLEKLQAHFRKFDPTGNNDHGQHQTEKNSPRLSSLQVKIDSLTIIDNIKSSTWKKFLTELRPNEGGLLRPTGEPMLRFKFDVNPSTTHPPTRNRHKLKDEAVIKLKISPLRLYVDQDAVDFLKGFFSFQKLSPKDASSTESTGSEEMFFQRVEILPIRVKLDYKPKRINYMALKEGKTIELMNFFHFEGSDMVLRHATLTGVSRTSKIGELLQEIWTPDVKANQLAEVISGISPVRSVVNLGTGIADLILLPIEELKKKDGRLSRGITKGTSSFAKNTTMEVIKLGARLATGTQVILEKAEAIFGGTGGSKSNQDLRVETIDHHLGFDPPERPGHRQHHTGGDLADGSPTELDGYGDDDPHVISKYANQPRNFKSGAQLAYQDLRENLRSTAQTILAIPLEVFNEGSGQAVVKAIPIAFIHPMVGASSALSKTLLGLQNSLGSSSDQAFLADKYKQFPRHP